MRTLAKRAKSSKQSVTPQPASAPFAFTPDGQVFINAAECSDRDLEGRAQFIGVLMSRKEARFARKVVDDAVCGAASKIAARMPPKKKTATNASTRGRTAPRPKSRKTGGRSVAPSGSGEAT
ncbi:MAG TPA: hypothetical protein VK459_04615 [Polyangiaceae bacterium]|nr:hypothetical protein [Polyangiaceae bacterium]